MVSRYNYDCVSLWVAEGNDTRTQIIGFNDTAHTVLANLPFRFGGMASLPDLHGVASHMTLIGEGRPGQPVPWLRLIWFTRPLHPQKIGRASFRERVCQDGKSPVVAVAVKKQL